MTGLDAHRPPATVPGDADHPALDLEERARAGVLDHPLGPGVDGAPVAAAGPVVARRVAPQPPLLLPGRGVRALALGAGERLHELQRRHRLGALALRDLEDAVVED